jgi:hypothetical protein
MSSWLKTPSRFQEERNPGCWDTETKQLAAIAGEIGMGKTYEELDERLRSFISKQKMFFVGSAPRSDDGLINISPKGFDTLRILDSKTVAYLDFTGSASSRSRTSRKTEDS